MKYPIECCLLGAGSRGYFAFGNYAKQHPEIMKIIAVAEPDAKKMKRFQNSHNINDEMCFSSWEELLKKPKLCDYLINATMDKMHYESTISALKKGYNILLEKPMGISPFECVNIIDCAKKLDKTVDVCHVLRYSSFFQYIKEVIESGEIGDLISIDLRENVGHYHYAQAYVRGNWAKEKDSTPMILSKSCHDTDIIVWLVGSKAKKISSFGSLKHFNIKNKPKGATKMCYDGCLHVDECPYSAQRNFNAEIPYYRDYVSTSTEPEDILQALKEGPYGRCVYQCDNDVVDHQVVNIEFNNGTTASFTMCGTTAEDTRYIDVYGTKGEINGKFIDGRITIKKYLTGSLEAPDTIVHDTRIGGDPHGGGDFKMLDDFVERAVGNSKGSSLTSAEMSLESHIIGFASEKSRKENKIIFMDKYYNELGKQ